MHRMTARFKTVAICVLCAVLASCAGDGARTICVVATTDVHGCIFDKDLLTKTERPGSLAKISTLLRSLRRENRNVVYMDCGDNLQGSVEVYQDITAQYYRTSLPARAFNLLECDAITFGNHDLAVSPISYERFNSELGGVPVLGGNICFNSYGDYLPVYTIIERDGVRMGVIGLVTPKVNYSIPADRLEPLSVLDPVQAARLYVPYLKDEEKVDVVIGLMHTGCASGDEYEDGLCENSVRQIVAAVPGFDLIMYGHDHEPACFRIADSNGDSVLVMNAGPYASAAAVATLSLEPGNDGAFKVSVQGSLTDVSGLKPDRRFMRKMSGWYKDVSHYSDSIVGTVTEPLECNGALWRRSSSVDFMHKMQMGYFGAQISLAAPVSSNTYIPAGNVNMSDMFGVYQYDNTMVSVMLRGSEIKDVLEQSASRYYEDLSKNQAHLIRMRTVPGSDVSYPEYDASGFISAAGIVYTIDVTKPCGARVEIVSMTDGKPFDPDVMYRTTINSYLYSGSGSAVLEATGLGKKQMAARLNSSTEADIRFYMITDLSLAREMGNVTDPGRFTNWKLVPESVVSGYLATDTVNFKLIEQ